MNIKRIKFYGSLTAALIIVVGLFILPRKVIIKNIECESQHGICNQRISDGLGELRGQSLFLSQRSARSFLSNELVKDARFQYKYPSTLKVSVIETKPEFALSNTDENAYRLVDAQGIVLAQSDSTTLPYVIIDTDLPNVGEKLSEKYLFGLKILSDLSYSYQLSKGNLSSDGLVIELPTKTRVLFPLEGDREILLGSFVLVINQLNTVKNSSTMDKVALAGKTVDLRFKNPVIR